ncbi:membrane protein [Eggerthia catenaformis]|nr:membrane protein [Eggerthia catenaformis]
MKKSIQYLEIIIGCLLTAASFGLFILPQKFAAGGITGLGIILSSFVPLKLSLIILLLNICLFLSGWIFISKEFILKTAITSFLFPVLLEFFNRITFFKETASDPLLSAIIAGGMLGLGTGLILRGNGSCGGFDTLGVILHKYFNLNLSIIMYVCDTLVILLQYHNLMKTIYGIFVIMISSLIVNKVLTYGQAQSKLLIFSHQYERIREELLFSQDIGLTYLKGETGYLRKEMMVIAAIAPYSKINAIKQSIYKIDPDAFVVIEDVHSVLGKGYTISR